MMVPSRSPDAHLQPGVTKSTSHHELSVLPEMVLNLKDFAANQ